MTGVQSAQSMVLRVAPSSCASSEEMNLITPPLVHTISIDFGTTSGEAIAAHTDNTNHASTKRASFLACLKYFTREL
jgi:hypothetical protein